MATALYRKYRPDSFATLIGQEHVTSSLQAALNAGRISHAYLFSGPRGCGKTTSARIMARCLNCVEGPTATPCGKCPSCIDLAAGGSGSLDVIEIDAASHNGVEDARELRERAAFAPSRDRYRVFILDEAHMVTPNGFNALLKLVEEPPEHIKFIFATTEPEKVLETIRSRTHHYPFRLVPPEVLVPYLQTICEQENVQVDEGVLPLVVRAGGGSVRDSLSVLDQLLSGREDSQITYQAAVALLGYTDEGLLDRTVEALGEGSGAKSFALIEEVVASGHDPRRFTEDLLQRLRDMLICEIAGEQARAILPHLPADQLARLREQGQAWGTRLLSRRADLVEQALREMTGASAPRLQLELLVARLLVELPGGDGGAVSAASGASGEGVAAGGANSEGVSARAGTGSTAPTAIAGKASPNAPARRQTESGSAATSATVTPRPLMQKTASTARSAASSSEPAPAATPAATPVVAPVAAAANTSKVASAGDLSEYQQLFEGGLANCAKSLLGRIRTADTKLAQVSGKTLVFTAKPMLLAKTADFVAAMQQAFGQDFQIQLVDVNTWTPNTSPAAPTATTTTAAATVASAATAAAMATAPATSTTPTATTTTAPAAASAAESPATAPAPEPTAPAETPAPAFDEMEPPPPFDSVEPDLTWEAPSADSANTSQLPVSTDLEKDDETDYSPSDPDLVADRDLAAGPVEAVVRVFNGKIVEKKDT